MRPAASTPSTRTRRTAPSGSVEDAILATILNGKLEAVVIYDGIPVPAKHDAPLLRSFLSVYQHLDTSVDTPREVGLRLARLIANIRPELDIYLLTDRKVEQLAGDPAASVIRRVFYEVEEPMEVHLNILEGVRERHVTPHFDNLKLYAAKPISTFHALPIARGKSIIKSNWIRDFGEFYGLNLFLAETSATTGGMDSMLEPTGNIKLAQDKFARAVGADHVFFVTNGTSTSNKMVYQAVTKPGDIVIVDRNCHKSHHYGMVLSGAQPLYVEAFPMTEYSMYGAVPLRTIKQALLDLKAAGRLDKVAMITLTNCTFDGHIYNTRRVMAECLAIKPDLIFLWDEAWFGFARWSPFLRMRTAMGAAAACKSGAMIPRRNRSGKRSAASWARIWTRRIRACWSACWSPTPRPCASVSTRPIPFTSRCPACGKGRSSRCATKTTNITYPPSARPFSSTPRPRPTRRSSHRWMWRAARWNWRVTSWSCAPSKSPWPSGSKSGNIP
ncbi:Orn/Lys/Arg decarboxylase, major domain protein [Achromobacter piechaudii ATCC 43553]|uniref:Orn/Lys/Arg decarboxylase, major domain protein n=1 Tax=Achromobacter piechaudii ATCC 43553 TaxID=742159 RepID=D4XGY0_9BURK|nr:Orn/Lys/Arg decarboxylase, major domain protein [Achromobacter piechaudii ATCC 43553]